MTWFPPLLPLQPSSPPPHPSLTMNCTWRKQQRPSIASKYKRMHVTTARSSADLTKPNQTRTRHTLAEDTVILRIATPQAASSQRTHVARKQGCARLHSVNRRVPTQYLHKQSVTTRRRCGCNGKHEAPRELSAHRGIGIAADQVESEIHSRY